MRRNLIILVMCISIMILNSCQKKHEQLELTKWGDYTVAIHDPIYTPLDDMDDIYLTLLSANSRYAKFVLVNNSDSSVLTWPGASIEVLIDQQWYEILFEVVGIPEEFGYFKIEPGEYEDSVHYSGYSEEQLDLPAGHYRLIKMVAFPGPDDDRYSVSGEMHFLTTEFDIADVN